MTDKLTKEANDILKVDTSSNTIGNSGISDTSDTFLQLTSVVKERKYNISSKKLSELSVDNLLEVFLNDQKEGRYLLARYLIEKHKIKTIASESADKGEILVFKDGYYQSGTNSLRQEIDDVLGVNNSIHTSKEILSKIKDRTTIERSEFEVEPRYLNFNNGVYDIEEKRLIPRSERDFMFRTKIPVDYDEKATCPVFIEMVKDATGGNAKYIFDWMAYSLYRRYFLKKAMIFVGERDTGKTTILNVIKKFFGEGNVSGVDLQSLTRDKFAAYSLYGRMINLYDDLSAQHIKSTGPFKIATGGGYLTAEKKFGDQFQFKNYAKLLFACNKIPMVKEDDDDAFYSRWIVVPFNNRIEGSKQDPLLADKMSSPKELSGILNIAINRLHNLLEKKSFGYELDPDAIKTEMLRSGSTIGAFVYDELEKADGVIDKETMYQAFVRYCEDNNLSQETKDYFGKNLIKSATFISDKNPTGKKRVWSNVRFKLVDAEEAVAEVFPEAEYTL